MLADASSNYSTTTTVTGEIQGRYIAAITVAVSYCVRGHIQETQTQSGAKAIYIFGIIN